MNITFGVGQGHLRYRQSGLRNGQGDRSVSVIVGSGGGSGSGSGDVFIVVVGFWWVRGFEGPR